MKRTKTKRKTPPQRCFSGFDDSCGATFNNKVFITHGKNVKVLNQIKEIVSYGNYQPIVAQEHETIAKPVPEKVHGRHARLFRRGDPRQ